MMNPSPYLIALNTRNWRMELRSGANRHLSEISLKQLSYHQLRKFGASVDSRPKRRTDEYMLCTICKRWFTGVCFKHPLLFIKEKVPKMMPYTVFDTIPDFLCLAASAIPNAGHGIFAKIDLPSGISFGPYSGYLSHLKTSECSGYSWQISYSPKDRIFVDAVGESYSNWMRYVNCARFEEEQNVVGCNINQGIYYYTYKPIPAGTEMLVWYGVTYGKYLGISNAQRSFALKAPAKSYSPLRLT